MCTSFNFITARKRSLRRLCFYRCLSVHNRGGMHGCSGGACVVAPGGVHGCSGGCAWLLGGMRGCSGGACVVALGGMCGFFWGQHVFFWGGVCGFFRGIGYDEIQSMSGRYASYWNAFLLEMLPRIKSGIHSIIIFFVIQGADSPRAAGRRREQTAEISFIFRHLHVSLLQLAAKYFWSLPRIPNQGFLRRLVLKCFLQYFCHVRLKLYSDCLSYLLKNSKIFQGHPFICVIYIYKVVKILSHYFK